MTKSDVENLNSKQCIRVIVEDNKDNDEVIVPDILAVKEQKPVSGNKEVDFYENEVDPDKKDVHSNTKEIDQDGKEIDHNKKEMILKTQKWINSVICMMLTVNLLWVILMILV